MHLQVLLKQVQLPELLLAIIADHTAELWQNGTDPHIKPVMGAAG